uniref:Ig-like domain-containing protein n=1 Tax=Neolamprologus brichardi TaxID=32507 RepID=A0A3Q4I3Y9_NEOBR
MLLCFVFPAETKPSLRKEMDEVTAKLGQPAVMKCQIIGRPVPEIKWYHAGKEIIESRKYEMSSDGRNHSLSIMTDQQEDEGEYTCKAINDAGEAETTGMLVLEAAPSFHPDYPLKEVHFAGLGTTLRIHAVYIGRPEPKIMWLHGAKTLENTEDISIETTEHYTHLVIKNVQPDDGTYRCKVVNEYGEDSAYAELFISSPPEFTLPLVNHTAYMGEDVRFGVTITVHPEPRVIWHKSGQKLIPGHDDKKYTFISDKGLYQLIIHNVETEDDAEYITATNSAGSASCQATLKVERTTHVKKEYEPSEKEKQKIAGKEELDKKVRLSQILAGTVVTPLPPAAVEAVREAPNLTVMGNVCIVIYDNIILTETKERMFEQEKVSAGTNTL